MLFRDLRRRLRDDGWVIDRQDGSHQQWVHPTKKGVVTVAGADAKDVKPGTLNSILKAAELK